MTKNAHFSLFFLFLLYVCPTYAQSTTTFQKDSLQAEQYANYADSILFENQIDSAIVYFLKSSELFQKTNQWDDYFTCFQGIAFAHKLEGTWTDFIKYESQLQPHLDKNIESVLGIYNALATAYRERENFEKSVFYYNLGLTQIQNIPKVDSTDVAAIYNNLGVTYRLQGDFKLSIEYYEKALHLYKKIEDTNPIKIARAYNNIGNAFRYLEEYKEAISYFEKALYLLPTIKENKYKKAFLLRAYQNAITTYQENNQYEKAAILLKELFKIFGADIPKDPLLYKHLGVNQYHYQQEKEALQSFKKGLQIANEIYTFKHTDRAILHNEIANIYRQNKDFKLALLHHQKALNNLTLDDIDTTEYTQNPTLINVISNINLLKTLRFKINTLQQEYEQSQDISLLEYLYQTHQRTDSLIIKMRQSYKVEGSKNYLAQNAFSIYESAIKTALQLYEKTQNIKYQEAAFTFAEKNKATILLESLKDNKAKFQHIPEHLIEQEKQLNQSIIYAEQKCYELEKKQDAKTEKEKWQNEIFDNKRKKENLLQQFAQNYPNYFSLKYNTQIASIPEIQKKLPNNQAIIEYFVGDQNIYTFLITSDQFTIHQISKPIHFQKTIQRYRKAISNLQFINDSTEVAQQILYKKGYQIYEWLLEPIHAELNKNIHRLIIIPDDVLGYINFEALPTNKTINAPFLIQDYTISQAYSTTLLQEQIQKNQTLEHKEKIAFYAGFAPQYPQNFTIEPTTRNEKLADLPNARKAVETLSEEMKGEKWIGQNATEENFKKYAPNFKLLHLAMHGVIDDQNPLFSKLIFTPNASSEEDDELHANELYNLQLNARLAVLSACNTGIGQLKKGEGMMSLSRAFTYAGCPSLVMSLWSIPSKTSAKLITQFHQNLQNGDPIDEALRQSKLQYLKTASPERQHPYFWAGFTLIGSTNPILPKQTIFSYKWLWGLLLVGLVGFMWFSFRFRSMKQ